MPISDLQDDYKTSSESIEEKDIAPEVYQNEEQKETFWGIYSGHLGYYDQQIVMQLSITGDKATGNYFYAKHQKQIQLSGTYDDHRDEVLLVETYKGKVTGHMKFTLLNDVIKGSWSKKIGGEKENLEAELISIKKKDYHPEFRHYERVDTILVYNYDRTDEEAVTSLINISHLSDDYFAFYFFTIGGNAHMGTLEGLATHSKEQGVYSDNDRCELLFHFKDKSVQVEESKDCSDYHGAHASFQQTLYLKQ